MITILKTSYLDQIQAVGLNTILEYSGISLVVEGCMTMTFDSKQPSIEFDSKQPSVTFKGRCINVN